ncbi:tyrosine-protein phosphatase [Streptomyces roseochromogenus]|uniref:Tyrosine specific protein phosphatases domain-containing protein n=1 Tax=Streptomyces roseochromogenus subsp. oscitans DS 12.976 TaxID=1352936 RepID=V6KQA2_STRRC|nr:tyrosine-protein phosphatase [Streptomyces roseochromogenus]EST34193.1 hypothetical protein M878_11315 [Streptomyces roseochromogenus subsp. oscitans DS 12.976]
MNSHRRPPALRRVLLCAALASATLLAGPVGAVCLPTAPVAVARAQDSAVTVAGVLNFRDAGGYPTAFGPRMRTGVLYRSGALQNATDAGVQTLSDLHVTKVVDFRTDAERTAAPDRLPAGASAALYPVSSTDRLQSFGQLLSMTADEQQALLGDGGAEEMMLQTAREFVTVPGKREQFGKALRDIADARGDDAVLVHCTGGRDRTGWLIAIVQTLLGVSRDDVFADYLRSNTELASWKQGVLQQLAAGGMQDPGLVEPLLDVDASYLQASFDQAQQSYGSFDAFVRDGLGIDDGTLARLRARLL